MKVISFKSYKDMAINPARANYDCAELRFDKMPHERSAYANRFLLYGTRPIMCLSFGVISSSDLRSIRTFVSGSTKYAVKDARAQFLSHELEHMNAFYGEILQASDLYYSGTAIGTPTISVGSRFVTIDGLKGLSLLHPIP